MNSFIDFIHLGKDEADKQKVLENISSNVSFKGSNLWILACAIIIASVGLNVNSTAVIIGAMLISPLMGPIVGAGFSLGTFDFALLKRSLKNLLIATFVSLTVSTLYFLISPFKEVQSEILARTSPNIYDLIIAFFGGLVGVIAITRVEKGNPIPGVAIATALMPPLCTAGYSLAIGNFSYFFGAFYLFTINAVFICISTFLIVKYLNYPRVKEMDKHKEKHITYLITAIILIVMIPSIFFAYKLYKEKDYTQRIERYIDNEFVQKGYTVIFKNTDLGSSPHKLELAFLVKKFKPEEIEQLNLRFNNYGISNTILKVRQDTVDLKNLIKNEIGNDLSSQNKQTLIIENLKMELNKTKYDNVAIQSEINILFPEIENVSISNHTFYNQENQIEDLVAVLYRSKNQLNEPIANKLEDWMAKRLNKEKVKLYWDRNTEYK
jgi:uncharacterized hydrophobic protein (TIGR00271 family)